MLNALRWMQITIGLDKINKSKRIWNEVRSLDDLMDVCR